MRKDRVAAFWNAAPCGASLAEGAAPGTPEFFERTERARYYREPFIPRFARFSEWGGKRVLEVGCGTGTDLSMFARHGACAYGIDLTAAGAALARKRSEYHGRRASTMVGDAENLPFPDDVFDLVYSWGVIHHTPDTARAAREMVRVIRPGGTLIAMIYHRRSLVALQAYLRHGLLRAKPMRPLREIIAAHLESPGTRAFTISEARAMFSQCVEVTVTPVLTPYDLRMGRYRFIPAWMLAHLPQSLGYFLVVSGRKAPG